jgi:hypothetical protein
VRFVSAGTDTLFVPLKHVTGVSLNTFNSDDFRQRNPEELNVVVVHDVSCPAIIPNAARISVPKKMARWNA